MTNILFNYELNKLFDNDVSSLIIDYMGTNKYNLNYINVIEEYKNRVLTVEWIDGKFCYILFDRMFNYRKLRATIYTYIYDNIGSIALLPKNY